MVDETREYIPSDEEREASEDREVREERKKADGIESEVSDVLEIDKDITIEEAVEIEACLDFNTEKYYLYTKKDCAGSTIDAKYIADKGLAKFIDCGCPDCDLAGQIQLSNPSTHNGTDGSITVLVTGLNKNPATDTAAAAEEIVVTGTPNYTYVIAPQNNEDAGKGAGAPIGSGSVANTGFTFGFGVTLQQTEDVGNPTYATSSAKGYVPAVSTSGASTKGLTAGTYTVYIFDSNSAGSCLFRKTIRLNNPKPLAGCTDNDTGTNDGAAFNYNTNASIDDNSCLYCRASDGKVTDNTGNLWNGDGNILNDFITVEIKDNPKDNSNARVLEGPQCDPATDNCYRCYTLGKTDPKCQYHSTGYKFDDSYKTLEECCEDNPVCCSGGDGPGEDKSLIGVQAATDSNNTDGRLGIAATMTNTYATYVKKVIDSNGELDAIFKLELYKLTETQYKNETISGGTKIGDTISRTWTLAEMETDDFITYFQTNPWMFIFDTLSGYNVTYGRYGIKVFMDDPDNGELEQCYQTVFTTVPVLACPDEFDEVGTTSDNVVITEPELFVADPVICKITNDHCCDVPVIEMQPLGPINCDGFNIKTTINCSPAASSLTVELLYKENGTWIVIGDASPLTPNITSFTASWGQNIYGSYGDGDYKIRSTSTFPRSKECVKESNRLTYKFPKYGCTDLNALNFNPTAECNDRSCIYPVLGCTDSNATNYDSNATQDDGSCQYAILGCTDPTANNFNPIATQDDNSCNYDPNPYDPEDPNDNDGSTDGDPGTGCDSSFGVISTLTIDATAASCTSTSNNGKVNVTISALATTKYQFRIVPPSGVPSVWYPYSANNSVLYFSGPQTLTDVNTGGANYDSPLIYLLPGGYLFQTVQLLPGQTANTTKCPIISKPFSVGADRPECGCTDPAATNYDPAATIDDGSCLYGGCTDPNAMNYDPNATFDDGTCVYKVEPYPCIPSNIPDVITKLHDCIVDNGTSFYTTVIAGRADDCSIMNAWKLLLIDHLINKIGLDCIYNCADSNTVPVTTLSSCSDIWVEGGVKTGLLDQGQSGSTIISGEGTTVTHIVLYFVNTNTLYPGDVIKMPSGSIWVANGTGISSLTPGQGFIASLNNPETAIGQANGMWTRCVQDMKRTSYSDNTNYLDNFITFVNKFCADCDIVDSTGVLASPTNTTTSSTGSVIPLARLDGINDIDI